MPYAVTNALILVKAAKREQCCRALISTRSGAMSTSAKVALCGRESVWIARDLPDRVFVQLKALGKLLGSNRLLRSYGLGQVTKGARPVLARLYVQ